jgi:hypothetical protein
MLVVEKGYDFNLLLKSLRALKDSNKYSHEGELEKAIAWMDSYAENKAIELRVEAISKESASELLN